MKRTLKLLFAAVAVVCSAAPAVAQFTTVSASGTGGAGHLVANATIYWQAVTGFRIGTSSGQALGVPYSATVTVGAFSLSVPDTSLSDPTYPCYAVTVIDNLTGDTLIGAGLAGDGIHVNTGGPYGCVQPSGSTWSFDSYVPAAPAGTMVVAGPPGATGVINWRGAWAATTAYAKNDGFVEASNGYIVKTAYTSGSTFGSTDTTNSVEVATGCGGTCGLAAGGSGLSVSSNAALLQGLGAANGLDLAQAVLHPWDDFDAANGTLVSGRVTPSGQTWACTGAGGSTAYIANQAYTGTDNTYCNLTDTQTVTEAQEVFSWPINPTATPVQGATMIFSSTGNVSSGTLLHMEMSSTAWLLLKSTGGGFDPTGYMANPPVELDGLSAAQVTPGSWLGGNLPTNGAKNRFRAVINSTACTYTAYMPDGTTWQFTDPDICTIGPGLESVIWQVSGPSSSSVNNAVINAVSIGPSKSENVASTNASAKLETQTRLVNKQWSNIRPTADGWYIIATAPTLSIYPTMGGTVKIYGADTAERVALFTINVGLQSYTGGTPLSAGVFSVTPYLTTTFAGGVIDQVRLSNDATTGNLQLDVHFTTPNYAGTSIAAEFDGYFTPVANPVVGAAPLTNWNEVLSTALPAPSYSQQLTGGIGWYTVFTAGSAGGYAVKSDFQIQAISASLGAQVIDFHVAASTTGCTIWQTSVAGNGMITQARCSYSSSSPYIQIDLYDAWSSTYPITLTGNLFGIYTVNATPTVGATVLSGGSQTFAFIAGTGTGVYTEVPTVNAVNMELLPSQWSICDGTCAGGAGANTPSVGPAQTFNVASPSLDNNSMEMTFTANANTTDVLFVAKPAGAYCAGCTKFHYGVWYYPTNSTGVTQHEFDEFTDTASGSLWMFGHQCSGGVWDVWNAYTGAWVPTSYTCSFAVNAWHYLVFDDSRIAGDTTGCSGYGCMYFNKLTVDGTVVYSMNQSEPAGPTPGGWANGAGAQFQEDVSTASSGSPVAVVSYYDLVNFTEAQ